MTKVKRALKNYLIYPKFQLSLVIIGILISALTFFILSFEINQSFNYLTSIGQQLNFKSDSGYFKLLDSQKNILTKNLIFVGLISAVISSIISIYISHRIVGPIYRLRKYFQDAKTEGVKTPLKFRDNDYFEDLPETINDVLFKDQPKK